jgi:hypothetical protein
MHGTKNISYSLVTYSDDTFQHGGFNLQPLPDTSKHLVTAFMHSVEINFRDAGRIREGSSITPEIPTRNASFSTGNLSWTTIPLVSLPDTLNVSHMSRIKVAWNSLYQACILLCNRHPLTTSGLLDAARQVTYVCFSPLNPWWEGVYPLILNDTATTLGFNPTSLLPVARDYILSLSAIDGLAPPEEPILPAHVQCVHAIVRDTSQLCWEILNYMQHQLLHISRTRYNVKLMAHIETGVEQAWNRTYRHIFQAAPFMVALDTSSAEMSLVSLNHHHKQVVITMNVFCRLKAVLDWFYTQHYPSGQQLMRECCVLQSLVHDLSTSKGDAKIYQDEYERLMNDYGSLSVMITDAVSRLRVEYTGIILALKNRCVSTYDKVALRTKEHIWSETVARQLEAIGASSHGWDCVDETCGCANFSLDIVIRESPTVIRATKCIASTIQIMRRAQTVGIEFTEDTTGLCKANCVLAPHISVKLPDIGFMIPPLLLPIQCESQPDHVLPSSAHNVINNTLSTKAKCDCYYAWLSQLPSSTSIAQVEQQLLVTGDNLLTFIRPYIETMIRVSFTVYGFDPTQEVSHGPRLLSILDNVVRVNTPHQSVDLRTSYPKQTDKKVSSIEMLSYIVYSNLLLAYTTVRKPVNN